MANAILEKGQRIGAWTLLRQALVSGRSAWACRCDCGKEQVHRAVALSNRETLGCRSCVTSKKAKDYLAVGTKIGPWRLRECVIAGPNARERRWSIECDCGFRITRIEARITGDFQCPSCVASKSLEAKKVIETRAIVEPVKVVQAANPINVQVTQSTDLDNLRAQIARLTMERNEAIRDRDRALESRDAAWTIAFEMRNEIARFVQNQAEMFHHG